MPAGTTEPPALTRTQQQHARKKLKRKNPAIVLARQQQRKADDASAVGAKKSKVQIQFETGSDGTAPPQPHASPTKKVIDAKKILEVKKFLESPKRRKKVEKEVKAPAEVSEPPIVVEEPTASSDNGQVEEKAPEVQCEPVEAPASVPEPVEPLVSVPEPPTVVEAQPETKDASGEDADILELDVPGHDRDQDRLEVPGSESEASADDRKKPAKQFRAGFGGRGGMHPRNYEQGPQQQQWRPPFPNSGPMRPMNCPPHMVGVRHPIQRHPMGPRPPPNHNMGGTFPPGTRPPYFNSYMNSGPPPGPQNVRPPPQQIGPPRFFYQNPNMRPPANQPGTKSSPIKNPAAPQQIPMGADDYMGPQQIGANAAPGQPLAQQHMARKVLINPNFRGGVEAARSE